MHDFEAANSDELELKRGDVVLVVPTASVEDQVREIRIVMKQKSIYFKNNDLIMFVLQEAGWLTGIKESDWLNLGVGAQRGLFPDNFTQRLE